MNNLAAIIAAFSLLLIATYLFFWEKFHKQDRKERKVLLRDVFGSPVHTIFVIGDGLILVALLNIFNDLTKEQSFVLLSAGIFVVVIGVILYRLLFKWFDKDPEKPERRRKF